ncbi:MAG: acyl carrier protein [Verrucomicrobiota bacterium]
MTDASLAHFPPDIRQAHARWLATHDPDALDLVIEAVVARHLPGREPGQPLARLDDSARLIDDLGYDSLAIAEIVFFIEDLYGVAISNQDLRSIRTIGELRGFTRQRIAAPAAN